MELNTRTSDLAHEKCRPCEGGRLPLNSDEVATGLRKLEGWVVENGHLAKTFQFRDYYRTIAFANAIAWISHREDHHPDLEIGYNKCRVTYITHAIQGLSENDFICAAKIDALMDL